MRKEYIQTNEPLFYIMKDAVGMEHKIINLKNPNNCPRKGIVEITVFQNKNIREKIDFTAKLKSYTDKQGIIWGIPVGLRKEGGIIFKPITLKKHTFFDLAIPDQAEMAAIVLNSKIIEGSPNLKGRPQFKVYDKEKQAASGISKKELSVKAYGIASKLFGEELRDTALLLGLPVEGQSEVMLMNGVADYAFDNPKQFLEIWNDENRHYATILKRAVESGVVVHDLQLGYMYNGLNLGKFENHAVSELRSRPDMATAIDTITKERKKAAVEAMANPVYKTIDEVAPTQENEQSELEKMKIQMLELAQQNAMLMEMMKAKPKEEAPVVTDENPSAEDEELASLRKRANELKIKGANSPHVKKETLMAKIAEAEAAAEPQM